MGSDHRREEMLGRGVVQLKHGPHLSTFRR